MIAKLLFASCLVAITVIIHAVGLGMMLSYALRSTGQLETRFWPITWLLIRIAWLLLVIHLFEVAVWALFFWWQALFGLFALLAVVSDGVMLGQSNLAAYGFSSIKSSLRPCDLENADLDPLVQASLSVGKLKRSVQATALAVASALVALAILLFVSPAPGRAGSKITYKTGTIATTTACGTVAYPKPPAEGKPAAINLKFTPDTKGATPQAIELSKISAIISC